MRWNESKRKKVCGSDTSARTEELLLQGGGEVHEACAHVIKLVRLSLKLLLQAGSSSKQARNGVADTKLDI